MSSKVLSERIMSSQPAGFPDSHAGQIEILGSGYWINADGERKREEQLVNVSLLVTPDDISVALGVHHDIWMWFDFSGRPHQSIYNNNKPRLSETLKEISEVLKTDIIPRDPTYFATPEEDGIATPTPSPDGFGRDETHML